MAYDQNLEQRLDYAFDVFPEGLTKEIAKKKMFGGLTYLFKGKMTIGIFKKDLMVRVIESKMEEMLKKDHVRPMDFSKSPMKEFIYVSPVGYETEEALQYWIELGIEHAQIKLRDTK